MYNIVNGTGVSLACMFHELLVSEVRSRVLPSRETQWNEPYYGFPWYVVIPPFHCPMILVVSTCNSNGIARVWPLAGFRY